MRYQASEIIAESELDAEILSNLVEDIQSGRGDTESMVFQLWAKSAGVEENRSMILLHFISFQTQAALGALRWYRSFHEWNKTGL